MAWPCPCLLCCVPWGSDTASLVSMPPQLNDCSDPFPSDPWGVGFKRWRGYRLIPGLHVGLPSSLCQLCDRQGCEVGEDGAQLLPDVAGFPAGGWPDSCWVSEFLPFSEPTSIPTFKGLLEVIIQNLLGQWVRLKGCPAQTRLQSLSLVAPFRDDNTPLPIPAPTLSPPWAALFHKQ